jgi:hypothetical protein
MPTTRRYAATENQLAVREHLRGNAKRERTDEESHREMGKTHVNRVYDVNLTR